MMMMTMIPLKMMMVMMIPLKMMMMMMKLIIMPCLPKSMNHDEG